MVIGKYTDRAGDQNRLLRNIPCRKRGILHQRLGRGIGIRAAQAAVSYTHLDVYKRQHPDREPIRSAESGAIQGDQRTSRGRVGEPARLCLSALINRTCPRPAPGAFYAMAGKMLPSQSPIYEKHKVNPTTYIQYRKSSESYDPLLLMPVIPLDFPKNPGRSGPHRPGS